MRHGETAGESSIRYHGRTDVPLSELGRAQVRVLAPRLAGHAFAAVVHSPLSRAAESAAILLPQLAARPAVVEVEEAFREVDFGALEGMTEGEIAAAMPDWHRAWRQGETDGYPGGETLAAFGARVARGCEAMLRRHARGDLLVVVHRGVIKRMLAHWLRLEDAEVRAMPLDLTSVTVVRVGGAGGGFELLQANVTRA